MRFYFELSPNTVPVPFDYQHFLIGTFHKWLRRNELHDGISLYSLSWLSGGKRKSDGLDFTNGAKWFVSLFEIDSAKKLLSSVLRDPNVCCGMKVTGVQIAEPPQLTTNQRFLVATPVLVKKFDGKDIRHMTFTEKEADSVLTQTLQSKMKIVGINDASATVEFDRTYPKARTKLVTIKGIHNRASLCPVIVKGTPQSVTFAWEVGVGHSTGSGFGALC